MGRDYSGEQSPNMEYLKLDFWFGESLDVVRYLVIFYQFFSQKF
jgi:hypothetical protein